MRSFIIILVSLFGMNFIYAESKATIESADKFIELANTLPGVKAELSKTSQKQRETVNTKYRITQEDGKKKELIWKVAFSSTLPVEERAEIILKSELSEKSKLEVAKTAATLLNPQLDYGFWKQSFSKSKDLYVNFFSDVFMLDEPKDNSLKEQIISVLKLGERTKHYKSLGFKDDYNSNMIAMAIAIATPILILFVLPYFAFFIVSKRKKRKAL